MHIKNFEGSDIIVNGKTLKITRISESGKQYTRINLNDEMILDDQELKYLIETLENYKRILTFNTEATFLEERKIKNNHPN